MPRSETPAGLMPHRHSRHQVLPSVCMNNVDPWRLYNISGLNHAACVLASRELHGAPHGLPRTCRYRPADGRWPGGTCTHWLIITNFMEAWPPIPKFQAYPGTLMRIVSNLRAGIALQSRRSCSSVIRAISHYKIKPYSY